MWSEAALLVCAVWAISLSTPVPTPSTHLHNLTPLNNLTNTPHNLTPLHNLTNTHHNLTPLHNLTPFTHLHNLTTTHHNLTPSRSLHNLTATHHNLTSPPLHTLTTTHHTLTTSHHHHHLTPPPHHIPLSAHQNITTKQGNTIISETHGGENELPGKHDLRLKRGPLKLVKKEKGNGDREPLSPLFVAFLNKRRDKNWPKLAGDFREKEWQGKREDQGIYMKGMTQTRSILPSRTTVQGTTRTHTHTSQSLSSHAQTNSLDAHTDSPHIHTNSSHAHTNSSHTHTRSSGTHTNSSHTHTNSLHTHTDASLTRISTSFTPTPANPPSPQIYTLLQPPKQFTPTPTHPTPTHTPSLAHTPSLTPTQAHTHIPTAIHSFPHSSQGAKILIENKDMEVNRTKESHIPSATFEHLNNTSHLPPPSQRSEEGGVIHFFRSWEAALIVGLSVWWVAALSALAFFTRTSLGQKIIEALCPLSCLARVEEEEHMARLGFFIDGSPGMRRPSRELLLDYVFYEDDDWMVDLLVEKQVMDSEDRGKESNVGNMWEISQDTCISQAAMEEMLTKRLEGFADNEMSSAEKEIGIMNSGKECRRQDNDDEDGDGNVSDGVLPSTSQLSSQLCSSPLPDSLPDPYEPQRVSRKLSLIQEETGP